MVAQAGSRVDEDDIATEPHRGGGSDREVDEGDRQVRQSSHGLHPLHHRYVLWYTRKGKRTGQNWAESIKRVHEFSTVEGFWGCYVHLKHATELPQPCDFHLFKEGIQPLWEDAGNKGGGKWILRFKKGIVGRMWEVLLLALIGGHLECSHSVCGAVISIRQLEDIISIWNHNAADNQSVTALKESIKKHLSLPPPYLMEYKPHESALKDQSSFRNTWMRH